MKKILQRKKLLFISSRFLFPADCGGKIRTRDVLRGMKGRKFDITLLSPAPPDAQERFADELRSVCDRFVCWPEAVSGPLWKFKRYVSLTSTVPVAVASDCSEAGMAIVIRELALDPDLVVADFPHSTVLLPPEIGCPSLLFTHNVEAEIFKRLAEVSENPFYRAMLSSQEQKMRRFEDAAVGRFDAIVAVSERDAKHFRRVRGADRVFVIPTGVDLDYFQYHEPRRAIEPDGGAIVFTGSMNWLANIDGIRHFMDEIWPQLLRRRPKVTMVVVGHSPPKALIQAARDRGLAWEFTGFVDDVRPHVRNADVYVIPLRAGGGTRIKAYEAMAMGCPIVSTAVGVEGLPLVSGQDCVIADGGSAFASAVAGILDDQAARTAIAGNARALVEQRFSAAFASSVFEDACLNAIALGQSGSAGPQAAPALESAR